MLPVRLLLVVVGVAIIPLCQASPIDPSWIPGIYDGADLDDIVILVLDGLGLSSSQAVSLQELLRVGLHRRAKEARTSGRPLLAQDSRGPPPCINVPSPQLRFT